MSDEKLPLLPDVQELCIEAPLYQVFRICEKSSDSTNGPLNQIALYSGTVDAYCLLCKKPAVFARRRAFHEEVVRNPKAILLRLECSRHSDHELWFLFVVFGNYLIKSGQYPSLADLQSTEIGQYRTVLGQQKYAEFRRAIGLAAVNVGIGSFVYLRRIFEGLVIEAYEKALADNVVTEETFPNRMEDKILALTAYLPEVLVETRALYGILSKGIHSLTEQECLRHFETVKNGIEIILDAKIYELERNQKAKLAKEAIQRLRGEIS